MQIRFLVRVLALVAVTAVVSAQSFDLKLGQWEYAIKMQMPPEALASLPPAARAMMQQQQTTRSCLTAQDLQDLNLAKSDDDECKVTSKKITGNTADIVMQCTGDNPGTRTMHVERLSAESMRGTMKSTGGKGPGEIAITGKWLAAACK